ncbi:class D beta-lactamase [Sediminitomix flava]|uniref:Beta-lactamase n=1 Tax=Sediminitomix flava TaxID=379075 RepID=A0A315ZCG5_SEDFL|nr:class D beta-lactamase [Sediminitomix flava]PWJ43010.1 beta-lactamase class D [Sediminitomix flava]
MRFSFLVLFVLPFFSCSHENTNEQSNEIIVTKFQELLDSAKLEGAILIYDLDQNKYYTSDSEKAKIGSLPASTFKIPNSIIALETGVVENDSTLFKWNGEKRAMKIWEQDLIFRNAFHYSCVPCYQEIAREIGVKRMNEYLDKLDYGNMEVDSSNIDLFWLRGNSKISPFQQIDFLKRFYQSELPISSRTEVIMKKIMIIEENSAYQLSGKTGWSTDKNINNGWFVGYIKKGNKVYFFANNVQPKPEFDMKNFSSVRKKLVFQALEHLKIL